jgi:hypothetical protein
MIFSIFSPKIYKSVFIPPITGFYLLLFYTRFCTPNCLHTASYLLVVIKPQAGELDNLLLTVSH